MRNTFVSLATLFLLAISAGIASLATAATLVKSGTPKALILLPSDATTHEKLAAEELVSAVKKMSGATLEVREAALESVAALEAEAAKNGNNVVVLGRLAWPEAEKTLGKNSTTRGAFALLVKRNRVLAAGNEEGTYYAVNELLEQLGCRWFMPGPLGEVIPARDTVEVATQITTQAPSFPSRWFQMPDRDWQMKVRCGGPVFAGGHGIPSPKVKFDKATSEISPPEFAEFFALYKGKRTTRQHCVSNPKFLEFVVEEVKKSRKAGRGPVIAMGPNDGGGFCQCERCVALDSGEYDAFSGEPAVTDRYIWFFNQILKGVEKDYPDTKLGFYIYHTYMRPPVKFKPDPRITGALAPIALDRVHGFSNPLAPEKSHAKWLVQEWGKIMPELYDRGYWSNLACPGFPFIITDRLRDEIPACHDLGLRGWRVETFPNYGPQFPSMYVAGKLMWNHKTDVDALLRDCFEKFFGPAAEPMGRYITLMDAALRDNECCTGSSWDMPHFYPPALRKQARTLLTAGAAQANGHGVYADRVAVIADSFEMVDAFNNMLDARAASDFSTAKRELERLDGIATRLMEIKPVPMLSSGRHSTYVNYMRRFFRHCTEQGFQRVTGGNQLIAAAKDQWQFQIDPQRVGEDIGLFRPENTGGLWQSLKTSSSSWSNQGLRYYKGLAWYRQTVDVHEKFVGQRAFLWCGGVDESAKVWLNGREVGISHGAAFYPFEMDATEMLRPGRNTIVFCVANLVVNELGTGGIVAPVMLYAPAAGKDAKLENFRDLKPTFP